MAHLEARPPSLVPSTVCALSFVLSYCSLSYQLLLARFLSQFENNEILVFSLTIGLHLLFLGFGSVIAPKLFPKSSVWIRLLGLEFALSFLGAISLILATAWIAFSEVTKDILIFSDFFRIIGLLSPIMLIGFLSGLEVPWLLNIKGGPSTARVLVWNYLGAFVAGFATPMLLVPQIGLANTVILTSLLNVIAGTIIFVVGDRHRRAAFATIGGLCLVVLTQSVVMSRWSSVEQASLKTMYLELRLERWWGSWKQWLITLDGFKNVERVMSPYQTIDIIPEGFMRGHPEESTFALYLNMKPQFSEENIAVYHESMVHGAIALSPSPVRKALVLGGGDGLIVYELLRRGDVDEVTLVELDPEMIRLARTHPTLRKYNRGALDSMNVRIVTDDAFAWIRRQQETWDAIFIDFPFPVTYELTKLYSVEFYTEVVKRLSPEGFFVLDAPVWNLGGDSRSAPMPSPQDVLLSTLLEAGITNWRLFGPFEPFFFVTNGSINTDFDENRLGVPISNKTSMNLTEISHLTDHANPDPRWSNRVFRPRRTRW